MAIWGAQTVRIDEFEYARERERAAELDVVRGGGIDARVRQGVSHRFVTIASYVMATVALLVALGVCRVALTTVTVSQLRSNVSLRSSIETAQKVNADLRIERSVLSSSSRICRIAEQNCGMTMATTFDEIALPSAEDEAAAEAAAADPQAESAATEQSPAPTRTVLSPDSQAYQGEALTYSDLD